MGNLSSVLFGLSAVPMLRKIRKVGNYNYYHLFHFSPTIENLNGNVGQVGIPIASSQ
jgi:hypothetical protein